MEGNQHRFRSYLGAAIIGFTGVTGLMATVVYLHYGDMTQQIVVLDMPPGNPVTIFVNIALVVGAVFTYPIQVFPIVEILESTLFGEGNCTL